MEKIKKYCNNEIFPSQEEKISTFYKEVEEIKISFHSLYIEGNFNIIKLVENIKSSIEIKSSHNKKEDQIEIKHSNRTRNTSNKKGNQSNLFILKIRK